MAIDFKPIPWDTRVIGKNVFELSEVFDEDAISFKSIESKFIEEQKPYMVFCKIDAGDINKIHFLESMGYQYIETQFHLIKRIKDIYEVKRNIQFSIVRPSEISEIIDIARETFEVDRYSIDPFIGKEISGQRYANWIMDSFDKPGFSLYKYAKDNEIIGFHLIKVENHVAYALLGGLANRYKGTGNGLDIFLLLNNLLYDLGVKAIDTYISAINKSMFNIKMFMQYQVKDIKVVLRKVYN